MKQLKSPAQLIALSILSVFLFACGSGIEDTNGNSPPPSKPEQGSQWDQMHWDKGKWQ